MFSRIPIWYNEILQHSPNPDEGLASQDQAESLNSDIEAALANLSAEFEEFFNQMQTPEAAAAAKAAFDASPKEMGRAAVEAAQRRFT